MTVKFSANEQHELEKLLEHGVILPAQPKIMREMDQLIHRPQVNMADIAQMVGQDPAITAIVFKVVASPIYGLNKPVDSLEKAISLIGLRQMNNIVKCAALSRSIQGEEPFYEWFWERSGDIAQLCAIIAFRQRMVCNIFPDQAHLVGLFHDCGVPLLMQRFPEYCTPFRLEQGRKWPDVVEEDHTLHTDHAVVGYLIAKHLETPRFHLPGGALPPRNSQHRPQSHHHGRDPANGAPYLQHLPQWR